MDEQRLDPDQLLTRIKGEKPKESRGRLKIFFGYAAGVGKTYAMLEAAHAAKDAGVDVVAGYIEPHTRPATLGLLDGLERLPPAHPLPQGGRAAGSSTSTARSRGAHSSSWWMSWPIRTPRAAATASGTRTSRSFSRRASTSTRR